MQAVTERQTTAVARGPAGVRLPSLLSDRRARVSRMVFRIPLWLYRLGLGWMLGHEFLVLTHVGRRTGRVHQTVLKVLRYDPATGESIVASAWGVQTDWYRNIQAHPAVAVQIARTRFAPRQRVVPPDEGLTVFRDWIRREHWFARLMLGQIGQSIDVPEAELRDLVLRFPFVGLSPAACEPVDAATAGSRARARRRLSWQ